MNPQLPAMLSANSLAGLNKLGDRMLPGDAELPGFSASGCARHYDRIAPYMRASDRADLELLLGLLAYVPSVFIAAFVWFLERQWGGFFRFMRMGLRGLVLTLYYSDPAVHEKLGYRVSVFTGDLGGGRRAAAAPPTQAWKH